MNNPSTPIPPWLSHLLEARKHIIQWLKFFLGCFVALYPFSQSTYEKLAYPLLEKFSEKHGLIATGVVSTFTAPLKLTLFLTFVLSLPFLLVQIWRFLSPALYEQERSTFMLFIFSGTLLFFLGISFCYLWALPTTIHFFQSITPHGVVYLPDMSAYLDFSLSLLLSFGVCFEIPVILVTLIVLKILPLSTLQKRRREVILACFIIAMLLTPPDVLSQVLLALPLWALYEFSIIVGRFLFKRSSDQKDHQLPES